MPPAGQRSPTIPRANPRRELGQLGEELAAAHLERLGFAVLARNVRTRHGEIDVIAFDGRTLVFAEVKSARSGAPAGRLAPGREPLTGLRPRQRARLRRLATAWLADSDVERPRARTIRFDAIGVTIGADGSLVRLDHIEGAW
jgi:putative endonuclease